MNDLIGLQMAYRITGGGYPDQQGEGICIGVMDYAQNDDVVCLATEETWGMPINIEWCSWNPEDGDRDLALSLRKRYVREFGERFKPVDSPTALESGR